MTIQKRDECPNVHLFFTIADAQHKTEAWRTDYNLLCPHGALASLPPADLARALCELPKTDHISRETRASAVRKCPVGVPVGGAEFPR
ncbi:MAG: transposase [Opitutae bacterium]|nr:transposase [Opitutae bacterium]